MLNRLKLAEERYLQLEVLLAAPDVTAKADVFRDLMKEYNELLPKVEAYRAYSALVRERASAEALYNDASADKELRDLAFDEMQSLDGQIEEAYRRAEILLLPRDPDADRDVIVEIRGCAGGEEAALFAAVLYRMYTMYASANGYRVELLSVNETELGGFKEVTFMIEGDGAYSRFKFESGVHRVQRVPETESQGRIQTSTATVAVLPEAEDVSIEINPADIIIESCKSSGAGGQHINKTESAVRLTHKPSGIVIECQEERSQFKNRDKAMKMLRTKLYDQKLTEQNEKIASDRRQQVGTGDRSERIRTYNYPQGRVTDHRIGMTIYSLESFLNGNIGDMIDALITADTAEKLKASNDT
jgi:peptide chain release factor 1